VDAPKRKVVKKVEGGHGHHGGAWKVAYADFVTAMMALFMVMWLLASTDAQSRKEISNYFRTGIIPEGDMAMNHAAQFQPSVIEASPMPPPAGEESLEDEQEKSTEAINAKLKRLASADPELAEVIKDVHVQATPEGILIEAVDSGNGLLFEMSSAKLKEPLERFLRALGPALATMRAPVEISGHTDARPFAPGATTSNWDLSYQRATAARDILEANGMKTITSVIARGSSQPYVPKDPLAAQNRRLSFLVKIVKAPDKPAPPAR
jgi:chemotaxis protein MotB